MWSWALACALGAGAGAITAGCSSPDPNRDKGDLAIEVLLPVEAAVQSLTYSVSGNGIEPLTEVVAINGAPTSTSALFAGLPAGAGYEIAISATCTDATVSCRASAMAEVRAKSTANLLVQLRCGRPPPGNVVVTASIVVCPQISFLSAAPVTTSVGGTIDLAAQAAEPGNGAPSYSWSAPSGMFSDPAAPISTFTCGRTGPTTITLTASSGSCADHVSLTVTCI